MESLGAILEDAVMLFKVPLERFWPLFLASPLSKRFAAGDPLVLAGKSGWEIAVQVLEDAGVAFPHERPDVPRAPTLSFRLQGRYTVRPRRSWNGFKPSPVTIFVLIRINLLRLVS